MYKYQETSSHLIFEIKGRPTLNTVVSFSDISLQIRLKFTRCSVALKILNLIHMQLLLNIIYNGFRFIISNIRCSKQASLRGLIH